MSKYIGQEEQELDKMLKHFAMKKIYINAYNIGDTDLRVKRGNVIETHKIYGHKPLVTSDPVILLAATTNPFLKIADPSAHEMLFSIYEKCQLPSIDRDLKDGDVLVDIWQYKSHMEDAIRDELKKNGYTLETTNESISLEKFNLASMKTYLERNGYKVGLREKPMAKFKCPKCETILRIAQDEPEIFFCPACKSTYEWNPDHPKKIRPCVYTPPVIPVPESEKEFKVDVFEDFKNMKTEHDEPQESSKETVEVPWVDTYEAEEPALPEDDLPAVPVEVVEEAIVEKPADKKKKNNKKQKSDDPW